jgi:dihydroorotate dehydrogenase
VTAYSRLFDTFLTRIDPERAHELGFRVLRAATPLTRRLGANSPKIPRESAQTHADDAPSRRNVSAMGLTFPHVLGLAAGFDKNAVGIDALAALGFGHVEIGTVTGEPQPGNPQPRLFRLPEDRAIINRMGFNNDGAEVVARRLAAREARKSREFAPTRVLVGVNIGKTKVVPDDHQAAVQGDYEKSAGLLAPHADYLVVNVSSPNTPGLRNLQSVEKLEPLLAAVRRRVDQVTTRPVPLLVKIAPDLADQDVLAVADLAVSAGLAGIIATNTTIVRDGLTAPTARVVAIGAGGLSGPPLNARSLDVLRLLRGRVGEEMTLISVGGITTVADARARLDAGATLLQGYTAFIYEGPRWPTRIVAGLHNSQGVDR